MLTTYSQRQMIQKAAGHSVGCGEGPGGGGPVNNVR